MVNLKVEVLDLLKWRIAMATNHLSRLAWAAAHLGRRNQIPDNRAQTVGQG